MSRLTHLDDDGKARMVDVSGKAETAREALAEGRVRMKPETLELALSGDAKKGDVRAVAEIAGIMGGKKTAELIPLCHPIALTSLKVEMREEESTLVVTAKARSTGKTGVEMEALTAVSVACLAIYDMLKAVDRGMVIEGVRLLEKSGGASGDWTAK